MNSIAPEERTHLGAFREAARQVRQATLIADAAQVKLKGKRQPSGQMQVSAYALDSEKFRSLAMAVRLVYQSNEPANFGHVCNILARRGDASVKERSGALRARYNGTLANHSIFTTVALTPQDSYSPRDAFETWLYYGAFHQDPARRADYEILSGLGERFVAAVQLIALQLAGRIMDLDDVVAEFLGEPPLPRIEPSSPGSA